MADDSEYNIVLIRAYLKNSGIELEVAENGRIAVEKVISTRPDLILMDLQMPVMDGLEATRAFATRRHNRRAAHPHPGVDRGRGRSGGQSLYAGCNGTP